MRKINYVLIFFLNNTYKFYNFRLKKNKLIFLLKKILNIMVNDQINDFESLNNDLCVNNDLMDKGESLAINTCSLCLRKFSNLLRRKKHIERMHSSNFIFLII